MNGFIIDGEMTQAILRYHQNGINLKNYHLICIVLLIRYQKHKSLRRNTMASENERVIEQALSLPADLRLNLIEMLMLSLNLPLNDEVDRLWVEEAERRLTQIDEGKVKLIPGDEVFARIRAKYEK